MLVDGAGGKVAAAGQRHMRLAEKRQQIDELYKKWEAAEERLAELTSADD